MTELRLARDRGHANHGWLDSWHTFSFADHYDAEHMGYGSLRVPTWPAGACLTGLVHLGLPADDPFWTARATDWTQKRIWSGQDVSRDRALRSARTK